MREVDLGWREGEDLRLRRGERELGGKRVVMRKMREGWFEERWSCSSVAQHCSHVLSLIWCLDFEWSQFVDCVWKWITSICHVSTQQHIFNFPLFNLVYKISKKKFIVIHSLLIKINNTHSLFIIFIEQTKITRVNSHFCF